MRRFFIDRPGRRSRILPVSAILVFLFCLAAVSFISAGQEIGIDVLFKDTVVLNGRELSPEHPLLEFDGKDYIAAGDLADMFNLAWAYDDGEKMLHLGADPFDEKEGDIVNLGPEDYHFHALWSHITSREWWGTFRVANQFYDNTFRRWLFDSQSRPSQVFYHLDHQYEWFSVKLGVADDTVADNNEPIFTIIGDGEVLYQTRLRYREPVKKVFLDVSDLRFLSFRGSADNDQSTNRLAIINPLLKEKHQDDLPEPVEAPHPSLYTDALGVLEGRYYKDTKPYREPPSVVTGIGTFTGETFLFSVFEDGWSGGLVHVGRGETTFDFNEEAMRGNICLIERGLDVGARMLYAQEAGAIGAIYYHSSAGMISNPTLTENAVGIINIPVIGISREDALTLVNRLEQSDLSAQVEYGDSVEGLLVDCGDGQNMADFPAEVAGNIALIEEEQNFLLKRYVIPNALDAGAVGVVFYNDTPGYMADPEVEDKSLPVIGISREDGLELIDRLDSGQEIQVRFQEAVE